MSHATAARAVALVALLCLTVAGTVKGEDGDGGPGAGASGGETPGYTLEPVDYDPFAPVVPKEGVTYTLTPVDFDPFAGEGEPRTLGGYAEAAMISIGVMVLAAVVVNRRNAKNKRGWTPLHYAAGSGQIPTVKALLDAGALVNVKAKGGATPLQAIRRASR